MDDMSEAKAQLASLYDSQEFVRGDGRCPVCKRKTRRAWYVVGRSKVGYLKCDNGHVLKWDCCGKRGAKQRRRKKEMGQ